MGAVWLGDEGNGPAAGAGDGGGLDVTWLKERDRGRGIWSFLWEAGSGA